MPAPTLKPCPNRPNCVSSEATDERHKIEPFRVRGPFAGAWKEICVVVAAQPRTKIVEKTDRYLHAVFISRLMRYRDDFELVAHPESQLIAVRSASRLGYRDFGVNRERVETLRKLLVERGLVDPS